MIEAKELRIGNKIEQGIIHNIGYSMAHSGYHGVHTLEHEFSSGPATFHKIADITPVTLTEQILKDHGFWVNDHGWWRKHGNNKCLLDFYEIDGRYIFNYRKSYEVELKYLHQLQNLYFELQGEELLPTM